MSSGDMANNSASLQPMDRPLLVGDDAVQLIGALVGRLAHLIPSRLQHARPWLGRGYHGNVCP